MPKIEDDFKTNLFNYSLDTCSLILFQCNSHYPYSETLHIKDILKRNFHELLCLVF